jgi:hypothetical protein
MKSFGIPILLITALLLVQPTYVAQTDSGLRKILESDDFAFSGMAKIFHEGTLRLPNLIVALDDPDGRVSDNAQVMLRLLGDTRGIHALHEWYVKPRPVLRIVSGPVPAPLQEWDYKYINDFVLSRSYRDWDTDAVNYLYALTIDDSPRAKEMLKSMLNKIPKDADPSTLSFQTVNRLPKDSTQLTICDPSGHIENVILKQAFFLSIEERQRTSIELLSHSEGNNKVLLTASQTYGHTFLIVLEREGSCWKYQSISLFSTNN